MWFKREAQLMMLLLYAPTVVALVLALVAPVVMRACERRGAPATSSAEMKAP
jgi:hypothetical protein